MNRIDWSHLPQKGDVLIIIPPFAGLDRPSLGAHVLQACAKRRNHSVRVLYANIILAARIGVTNYSGICYSPTSNLFGERFFCSSVYEGFPAFGHNARVDLLAESEFGDMADLDAAGKNWVEEVSDFITATDYKIVGASTTFEQTNASLALLKRVKEKKPGVTVILGGGNCEGEMSLGVREINEKHLNSTIDHIFSGESEVSFPDFLDACLVPGGQSQIIEGTPLWNMDELPNNCFDEYYEQLNHFLPDFPVDHIWLPYESSRGCWWGQKSHCTFCGVNGATMKFRQKGPDKVISELSQQLGRHPSDKVCMVDNIMPYTYFDDLLPRMKDEIPRIHMFYEQKANLTLRKVKQLKEAGVAVIQPGIEALADNLLKLMKKGVTAKQNIHLLRFSRMVDLSVNWNLLYAFPGDELLDYIDTIRIIPYIRHLHPASGVFHLSIDRFSPYFNKPAEYGISNVRPMRAYQEAFPTDLDLSRLAYHFTGDYASESKASPDTIRALEREVDGWRAMWVDPHKAPPSLQISRLSDEAFLLFDTREIGTGSEISVISPEQAITSLFGNVLKEDALLEWGLANKVLLPLGSGQVPLATADEKLYLSLEAQTSPKLQSN